MFCAFRRLIPIKYIIFVRLNRQNYALKNIDDIRVPVFGIYG